MLKNFVHRNTHSLSTYCHRHTHTSSVVVLILVMIKQTSDEERVTTRPLSSSWSTDGKYTPPHLHRFSPLRLFNNYITTAGIWSPLGLSETAIFDLLYRGTEPFPQDGARDGRLEGTLPSWGCHLSVPYISISHVRVCFNVTEFRIMLYWTSVLLFIESELF